MALVGYLFFQLYKGMEEGRRYAGKTLPAAIKMDVNPYGRVVLNGFFGFKNAHIDWDSYTTRNISLIGALGSPNIWDEIIYFLETGKIETKNLISHEMHLQDFEKALDIMVNRKENVCKIILKP